MPYRDDLDALTARCEDLERKLAAIRNRTDEINQLKKIEADLARELADARRLLERVTRRRSLDVIDDVRVASPCNASWEDMRGDERVRFCGECQKHVYNLSRMSRAEGERLIRDTEGELCVRLYRRGDGTVLTTDCPVGLRKLRFRRFALAGAGIGILAAGAIWASAAVMGKPSREPMMGAAIPIPSTVPAPQVEAPPVPIMGEIEAPPVGPAPAGRPAPPEKLMGKRAR
jgi:hypothetical protein